MTAEKSCSSLDPIAKSQKNLFSLPKTGGGEGDGSLMRGGIFQSRLQGKEESLLGKD